MANAKVIKEMTDTVFAGVKSPAIGRAFAALTAEFPLATIQNKQHYKAALEVIERIMTYLDDGSPKDGALISDVKLYFKTLADLVAEFESQNFPIDSPSPRSRPIHLGTLEECRSSKRQTKNPCLLGRR